MALLNKRNEGKRGLQLLSHITSLEPRHFLKEQWRPGVLLAWMRHYFCFWPIIAMLCQGGACHSWSFMPGLTLYTVFSNIKKPSVLMDKKKIRPHDITQKSHQSDWHAPRSPFAQRRRGGAAFVLFTRLRNFLSRLPGSGVPGLSTPLWYFAVVWLGVVSHLYVCL